MFALRHVGTGIGTCSFVNGYTRSIFYLRYFGSTNRRCSNRFVALPTRLSGVVSRSSREARHFYPALKNERLSFPIFEEKRFSVECRPDGFDITFFTYYLPLKN